MLHYLRMIFSLINCENDYAMPKNVIKDETRLRAFISYIWWTTWATETIVQVDNITYTNNWPNEELH